MFRHLFTEAWGLPPHSSQPRSSASLPVVGQGSDNVTKVKNMRRASMVISVVGLAIGLVLQTFLIIYVVLALQDRDYCDHVYC